MAGPLAAAQAQVLARLAHSVRRALRWRSDAIKAGWAVSRLERLAGHVGSAGDREVLRDAVQQLGQEPACHRLRVLDAAHRVSSGAVVLPAALEAQLTRLAVCDDPAWVLAVPGASRCELADAAVAAAHRWRVFANAGASPAQSRVAQVAHRGFFLLSQSVRGEVVSS